WGARVKLGKTEVKNFGVTTAGDENVSRFDISMDDAFGMRSIKRIRHVNGEGEERVELMRTVCQRVLECLTIEILHHDERTALVITDFINSTNIRMVKCRSRTA